MGQQYGVSAAHPLAAEAGLRILAEGGNAVDAAIATAFALGVVEPYASGIGGGGNMLIYPTDGTEPVVYDYREIGPSVLNPLYNTGVPGMVKGMEQIAKDQGVLPLAESMQPAIELAENGFEINEIIARNLAHTKHSEMFDITHMYPNKKPLQAGERLVQKELAETMKHIATEGSAYFYTGELAAKMINTNAGFTHDDLVSYDSVIRKPVHGRYHGHDVYAAPAPVGGALIIQALQVIERLELDKEDPTSASFMAALGNVLQTCNEIRMSYIGDPTFVSIDEQRILDETYVQRIVQTIQQRKTPPNIEMKDINNTTHFSVIDGNGMVVSTTQTLSNFFGSGVHVAGFFLNNQMQNFTKGKGSPNVYVSGKRCQSIIAPTVLSTNGRPWLAIGASGAARIPTLITTVLLKYIRHGYSIADAIADQRHFASETDLYSEKELSEVEQRVVKEMGYTYIYHPEPMFYGGVQAIALTNGKIEGAGDPRRGGVCKKITHT